MTTPVNRRVFSTGLAPKGSATTSTTKKTSAPKDEHVKEKEETAPAQATEPPVTSTTAPATTSAVAPPPKPATPLPPRPTSPTVSNDESVSSSSIKGKAPIRPTPAAPLAASVPAAIEGIRAAMKGWKGAAQEEASRYKEDIEGCYRRGLDGIAGAAMLGRGFVWLDPEMVLMVFKLAQLELKEEAEAMKEDGMYD